MTHVDGTVDRGEVILYALSTCVWCRKTRQLLEELGVAYDYEYVDLLPADAADGIDRKVTELQGRVGYPTLITAEGVIQGYRPDEIKKLLNV